jgi:hypothetical protein
MSTKHLWKTGFSCPVSCEVAVQRIEVLRARSQDGRVAPSEIVEDARPKNAVLHSAFEWDDKAAAAKHREEQARRMLRSVVVVTIADDGKKDKQIAYVSTANPFMKGAGYMATSEALAEPTSRELVLSTAWAQLKAWQQRWGKLVEFSEIVKAIEEATQQEVG